MNHTIRLTDAQLALLKEGWEIVSNPDAKYMDSGPEAMFDTIDQIGAILDNA